MSANQFSPMESKEPQLEREQSNDKTIIEEVENPNKSNGSDVAVDRPKLVSNYAHLTPRETIYQFKRLFFVGFLASFAGVYLGYTLNIPGSVIANRGFVEQFGTVIDAQGELQLDANYVGLWSAISFVSQVVFQAISPITANKFGLRINMFIFTGLITLAIILEIIARTWYVYLIAKIICGFAAGFIGTSVMAYVSEITIPKMRGTHLSAFSLFFAIGGGAVAIAMEVLQQTTPMDYRRAFYSEFAFLGIWLPILIWLPESPAWCYKKGKHEKAHKALRKLIGNVEGYDWDHEYAVMGQEIDESLALMNKSSKLGWVACFKGTNLRRTIISTIPFSMQNFVGGPLMFNVPYFFSLVGLQNVAFSSNLIVTGVLMAGIIISFFLVDRFGRRPLLLVGGTVMSICVFVVGGIGTSDPARLGGVLVAMCSIWVLFYAISVAPIGWLSLVENSTPMLRTQTAGIAAVMQSCSGVLFNYTVPIMLSPQYAGWGAKIGFFFGPLAAISTVIVWFTVPETKGRSYAELDELYERRIPAWRFSKEVTTAQKELEKHTGGETRTEV